MVEPLVSNQTLADKLDRLTIAGVLWNQEGRGVRCLACGHRCLIAPGQRGICKVRFNLNGKLRVPFGYVAGLQTDPVEKKPFYHVLPGRNALTFGMLGCDLHCSYCQNWMTSQALRDPVAVAPIQTISAEQVVATAQEQQADLVVSSYNEPLITAEWAGAIFDRARKQGLMCAIVSNGHGTPEVIRFLKPLLSACKVDLKSFAPQRYREFGGNLDHVKNTIRQLFDAGIWLEIVTLLVPGYNDEPEELRGIARFLVEISPAIPWHVTAYHQDYEMTAYRNTNAQDLVRAAELGIAEGLQFVYAGNMPGRVGKWENTRCPNCQQTVVERRGFNVVACTVTPEGKCPGCQQVIPGIWKVNPEQAPPHR